jgi:nucleobase:cation symporter-1, NCS1 family
VAQIKGVEQHSIDYVPLRERHGKPWHLWPIWFTGGAHLATIASGFIGIALGGNLLWTAIAVLVGCALGTFFMAFHSTQGPQLGLPQMIQSRPQFGYVGALLVWAFALITFVGYCAFNQVLVADTVVTLVGGNRHGTMMVVGLVAVTLAVIGYDLIHKAQQILAYLLLAVFLVMTVAILRTEFPPGQLDIHAFRAIPFLTQLLATAGYQLSWSIFVSDYSRYLPRDVGVRASFWWTFVGAYFGTIWPTLLGTVAAAMFPKMELTPAVRAAADVLIPGSGTPFLVASVLGLVTTSTLMFYSASLTLLSVADTIRPLRPAPWQRPAALLLLLAVTWMIALGSSPHFAAEFGEFLAILGYLFTPWTAVNLVDFYYVRRGHYSVREIFNPDGMYGRWNWNGILAYLIGFAVMVPFFSTGIYRGPVAQALGGADVAMLVGLPVSTAIYLFACRSFDLNAEVRLIAVADRGLDPDA